MRIRGLLPYLFLGDHPPGLLNSLADVPGIAISTQEITSAGGSINTELHVSLPEKSGSIKLAMQVSSASMVMAR